MAQSSDPRASNPTENRSDNHSEPSAGPTALAELSTLRSQLDDLARRVTDIADRYAQSPDSAVASSLFAAEQALLNARLRLDQASERITDTV